MELNGPLWRECDIPDLLSPGIARVWRTHICGADWRGLLSAREVERLARFRFVEDAQREATGRGALRFLLGRHFGIPVGQLRFHAGSNGKPALEWPRESGINFNISHSGSWVLLAFSCDGPIGVDIEQHRALNQLDTIARDFFEPREYARWMLRSDREAAFFDLWTVKEAYLKAVGTGLAASSRSFRVDLEPGGKPAMTWCADDAAAAEKWQFALLAVDLQYSAALACGGGISKFLTFTLPTPDLPRTGGSLEVRPRAEATSII
jgi:4'-phosphopantetheinyl transferase